MIATLLILSTACVRSPADVDSPPVGVTLTGQVVARNLQSGTLDPIQGAVAELLGTSFRAVTNATGAFRFDGLPVGSFDLLVTSTGAQARSRLVADIELNVDGQSFNQTAIELGEPRTIEGQVGLQVGSSSVAAVGARVWLVGTNFFTFADSTGTYRLSGVPDPWRTGNDYEIAFYLDGYQPFRVLTPATAGRVNPVASVTLAPANVADDVEVVGIATLVGPGSPNDVVVTFIDEVRDLSRVVNLNLDGEYRLRLVPGVYRARFEAAGFAPVELPGIVLEARNGPFELRPVFLAPAPQGDLDGDGIADEEDDDRDNDGVPNDQDAAPDDPTRTVDETPCAVAPDLITLQPTTLRAGETLTVSARPISPPACAPTGSGAARLVLPVRGGTSVSVAPAADSIRLQGGDGVTEDAEYIIPTNAISGPVFLAPTYDAQPSAPLSLTVLPALMEVTRTIPLTAPPSAVITLVGRGFIGFADDSVLQVELPTGIEQPVTTAEPGRFQIRLPSDLPVGLITARVTNGARSATFQFRVSTTVPVIEDYVLESVEPGVDTLGLIGLNLDVVDSVVFANGVTAAPTSASGTQLFVEPVPVGIAPGPITLTSPGQLDVTSQTPLSLTFEDATIPFLGDVSIAIDPANGAESVLEFTRGSVQRYEYATLQAAGPAVPFTESNVEVYGVMPRPAHDRAVVIANPGRNNGDQILVVQLSDLSIVGQCDIGQTPPGAIERGFFKATFTDNERYAYIYEPSTSVEPTLIRIDMEPPDLGTSACVSMPLNGVCNTTFAGNVTAGSGRDLYALLDDPTNWGIAFMEVVGSPPQLSCAMAPTPGAVIAPGTAATAYNQNGILWARVGDVANAYLVESESAFAVILGEPDGPPFFRTLPQTNWVTSGVEIFDGSKARPIWSRQLSWRRLADVHPTRPEFLVPTSGPPVLRKLRIVVGSQ